LAFKDGCAVAGVLFSLFQGAFLYGSPFPLEREDDA